MENMLGGKTKERVAQMSSAGTNIVLVGSRGPQRIVSVIKFSASLTWFLQDLFYVKL